MYRTYSFSLPVMNKQELKVLKSAFPCGLCLSKKKEKQTCEYLTKV